MDGVNDDILWQNDGELDVSVWGSFYSDENFIEIEDNTVRDSLLKASKNRNVITMPY